MQIESNKVVALAYNLSLPDEDGEMDVVEVVSDQDPMYFIFGQSGLPEGFENNLATLKSGDTFNFQIDPEEGYGVYDPDALISLPKTLFQVDGQDNPDLLKEGNIVPMTNEEGHSLHGQIIEIHPDTVLMDFNHPLAGKVMHFSGHVISVREATKEELEHGHVHGEGGVHHH